MWSFQQVLEVDVEHPTHWYGLRAGRTGPVPDPIVPAPRFSLSASRNQALLLTVRVPAATPAGRYRESVDVQVGDECMAVAAIKLLVWDITLPPERSLKSVAPLYKDTPAVAELLKGLGVTHPKYGAMGLRISYDAASGVLSVDTLQYEESMRRWIDEMGFAAVMLPPALLGIGPNLAQDYLGTGIAVGADKFWPVFDQYMTLMADFYRRHGWQNRVVWYMMDEIYEQHYPLVSKIARRAKVHFPELTILLTTDKVSEQLAQSIDVWVVPWHFFVTRMEDIPRWDRLREDGLELFAYMNSLYFISADWSLGSLRLFPAVLAKYQYTGCLWWGLAVYGKGDPWQNATTSIYKTKDKTWSMANGYFIYPPRPDDPCYHSSLRWESYQQGLDEYKMLEMLRRQYRDVAQMICLDAPQLRDDASFNADAAIRHWGAMLANGFRLQDYRPDFAYITQSRQLLAHEITQVSKDPLGLVDVTLDGYRYEGGAIEVAGMCSSEVRVTVNGTGVPQYSDQTAYAFATSVALADSEDVIAVTFTDRAGVSKTLYRQVSR